jgi:RHS repeat-associated protein
MKKTLFLLLVPVLVLAQSANQNYIKTTTYKGAGATLPVTQVTYFDGLGRPIQQIANAQSNSGKDIVTHTEYDTFGRQTKEYLPYANTTTSLNYNLNAGTEVGSFYANPNYDNTLNPYSEKLLENSPLSRVFKQAAPGNAWALGSGHEIKLDYQTNTATEVKYFKATATWNAGLNLYDIAISNPSDYAAEQLYKTITKDENWSPLTPNGGITQEFKNKEGQVILKRNFNAGNAHDTYYVYDQYGNLTYVLPPLAEGGITTATLNGLCYQYKYDYRNRLVAKKIPGKQWEYIVYDIQDRPVATGPTFSPFNDGTTGVLITEYDAFGRVSRTGYKNMAITDIIRNTWQIMLMQVEDNTNPFALTTNDVLTKNYYDNYTYPGAPTLPTTLPDSTYPIAQNVKGMATGSWVRVLTTPTDLNAETSYTFYDDKYRPVRTYTKNHLGGFTQTDSNLDFIGKTNYTITTHKRMSTDAVLTVKDNFTYSPQDRLLLYTQQINTLPLQLIASNTYDELGQLMSKNVGGTDIAGAAGLQKVDYNYNIRGWLKSINDTANLQPSVTVPKDLFAFKINYNDPASAKALYNGNISETFWKTNSDNTLRKYNYAYDNLNRLTYAVYAKPDVASSQNNYGESISYDKNGNITFLARTGGSDSDGMNPINPIDNLIYDYDTANNANRLLRVFDTTNNPQGFKDNTDGVTNSPNSDYTYDANGNMITDANKGITNILYNHLNLPTKITINGKEINYIYNAMGTKIKKTVPEGTSTAIIMSATDYLQGGYQYKNNVLQFFPHAEGYVNLTPPADRGGAYSYDYVFNYTDHLGNIRLSYMKDPITGATKALEENNYYPFGLKHTNYNSDWLAVIRVAGDRRIKPVTAAKPAEYFYRFGSKELQTELGLNVYDFGARGYMPDLGRWMGIDLKAEKFNNMSPYVYGLNDPTNVIDPDGMDGIRIVDTKNKTITVRANYYVQTQARTYYTTGGRAKTFDGYSSKDIAKMQKDVNGYLNKDSKSNIVTEGEHKGYTVLYDLQFKEGGTVEQAKELASKDKINGDSVGNSIERSSSSVTPYFATKESKPDANGNVETSTVGGNTVENKNVTMNSSQDNLLNRIHEFFHTFGFSHPKAGGNQGIMNYPPQDVSKKDVNKIANDNFLPKQ